MAAIPETKTSGTALEVVRDALSNDYEVKEELGRGGMAMVFRGVERSLGREVAIKVLPFTHIHDANLVERFENEARTSASLEHPNIIPIYRVGRSEDVIYFAMRYLCGPSLAQLINEMAPMDPRDIRRILIESSRALGYAHQKGIVHRDIKPDNILFKESGEAVLCDFGIAKAISGTQLTETGKAIGTPYYMSPEQIRAQDLDGRSDIYSLGVVAYQCFTKQVPFDGEDVFSIGYKHVTEEVPMPDLKTSDQRNLFGIILRMMSKEPTDRYQTANELIEALTAGKAAIGSLALTASQAVTIPGKPAPPPLPVTRAAPAPPPPPIPTPATPVPTGGVDPTQQSLQYVVLAQPPKKSRAPALLGMLMLLGGLGGGGYYYVQNTEGPLPAFLEPLAPLLGPRFAQNDDAAIRDSLAAFRDSLAAFRDSLAALALADSIAAADSLAAADSTLADSTLLAGADSTALPADSAAGAQAPTTGHLVVAGVDESASLWIDDRFVSGSRHDLPPGSHALRVAAPGFSPYTTAVNVIAGDTVVHRVRLARAAQCEHFDRPGYNANGACFDIAPGLRAGANTLVPLPNNVRRRPSQPAILAIQVNADGTAGTVLVSSQSDVPQFTIAAIQFAKQQRYRPATRRGTAVVAWVELQFYPGQ